VRQDSHNSSDPATSLSKVAQEKEQNVVDGSDPPDDAGEVLRGIELCLDLEENNGFVLARDYVPRHMLDSMFTLLRVIGWRPIEDDEGTEPYDFWDGSSGVQIWLYRTPRPVKSILADVRTEPNLKAA